MGEVGAGFYAEYAEYPNNSPKQAFFLFGIYSTVFHAEVLAISEVTKNPLLEKMHNQSIVVLVDSQAAIKAPTKCTVASITMFNCMIQTILIVLFPNAGFEILTSYWLVIALGQYYDVIDWSIYQREKSITILKHDFCGDNY